MATYQTTGGSGDLACEVTPKQKRASHRKLRHLVRLLLRRGKWDEIPDRLLTSGGR